MASLPCRKPITPRTHNQIHRVRTVVPLNASKPKSFSAGQVATNLEQLCEMGLLEAFRDDYNIVRYRPIEEDAALRKLETL